MGDGKAHAAVVVLLGGYAVEADGAAAQMGHAGIPHRPAVPLAAPVGAADIEADEAEIVVVAHRRYGGDQVVARKRADEAGRVGDGESLGIAETGVPAFRRRPAEERVDPGRGQRPDRAAHAGANSAKAPP
jgi:hypothetical protein